MALNLFTSRVDAIKIIDGISNVLIGDKDNADITAAVVGNGNFLFDPKTGKVWSSDGSVFTDTTESLTAGTTDNAILKWDAGTSAWVEETDFTVTDAGLATAAAGFTASGGNIVASTGNITSTLGSVSAGTTITAGTGVTATTGGVTASAGNITATTGNIVSTAGSVSAATTVTAGTGVTATTGGLTATAGGLTVTAGTTDINDVTNISGAVTLDNAAANSLSMSGTTNTIDLTGSGAHELQMAGTTNIIDLNGSGAQSIEMAGTANTITMSGSGNRKIEGLTTAAITAPGDAANKAYVDAIASGLSVKNPTTWATAANLPTNVPAGSGVGKTITLTGLAAWSPDGTAVTNGDTVTVRSYGASGGESTTSVHNGVYIVSGVGSEVVLTRVTPYDEASEVTDGSFFFVLRGATYANTGHVQTQTIVTVDTTPISFAQFSAAGVVTLTAGDSITVGSAPNYEIDLAADLDTGATGFTISDGRVPFATAANTLGANAHLTYDNTYKVVGVGDPTSAPTNSALIFSSSAGSGVSTLGTAEPINEVFLATDTDSADLGITTGRTSGTGISGDLNVQSGAAAGSGNSGTAFFRSGGTNSGDSGMVEISTGVSVSGNRGSILIQGNVINLDGLDTNAVVLTSAATDQETGSTTGAVATIALIRENVVLRKTGTTSVALVSGASAAKFLVYVQETATVKYASEVLVTSTNATTGVDSVEYSIIGTGTMPAGLAITAAAAAGVVQLTVAQTNSGTIIVEAIPLV